MKIDHLTIDEVSCFENSRRNGVIISWSANIGLGELTLYQRNGGDKWKADTEYMCTNEDKEFIRIVLNKWVDEIEVEK